MAISSVPDVSDPFYEFNNDDHTALVASVTLIFALINFASIIAKLLARRGKISLQLFDYILFVGAALLLIQTGLVINAVKDGLGLHADVSGINKDSIPKLQYVASLLAIAATTCTKISMCLLIKEINDHGKLRYAIKALLALISVFFLTSILTTAFQCPLPTPWLAGSFAECPRIESVYAYVNIGNILTDVLLSILATAMVWKVQTARKQKAVIIALFAFRIICPITIIPSLLDTRHLYNGPNDDFTWLSVMPTTWLQASYNLSVITACIPSMKIIFDSFFGEGTHMAIDMPYQLTTVSGKSRLQATAYTNTENRGTLKLTTATQDETSCYTERNNNSRKFDDGQSESVQNLTDGVIIQKEFEVHFDDNRSSSTGESHIS